MLLVSLDTLRADRVGAWGYERDTTPFLDRLAAQGAAFLKVAAPSSRTASSHMSMFTGLRPSSHGVINFVDADGLAVSKDLPLLAEIFERGGYHTAGFTDGGMMRGELGFERGFDIYDHSGGGAQPVFDRGALWLRERDPLDEPFLLFLHTYEIHDPYTPPKEWQDRFASGYKGHMNLGGLIELPGEDKTAAEHLTMFVDERTRFWQGFNANKQSDREYVSNLYDAGVAYTDHLLGEFWKTVEELGLAEDLLVVIFSDHGEAFMEHGYISHRTIHEEILHVPLIVRLPGGEPSGVRIERQIEGIDLTPSLLELCGFEIPDYFQGRSWVPDLYGRAQPAVDAWSELASPGTDMAALRRGKWKLIALPSENRGASLFDLEADPLEKSNRYAELTDMAEDLRGEMRRIAQENLALRARFEPIPIRLDQGGLQELIELGYTEDVPEVPVDSDNP